MDHVVYLDAKAKEYETLFTGEKSMLIRGAAGRKMPYGRVKVNDVLYFLNNNAEGVIKARVTVKSVINSEKMSKNESAALVEAHQGKLRLTTQQYKRWAGKRYLVLIEVDEVEQLKPFPIDKSAFGNMDDWLLVEAIGRVKV